MRNVCRLVVVLGLLSTSSALAALTPPALSWRAIPANIDISADQANLISQLSPWKTGADASFYPIITTTTDPWVAFQAGSTVNPNTQWMITFGSLYDRVTTSNGSNTGNCQMASSICSTDVTLEFQQSSDVSQNNNAPTTGWSRLGTFQSWQVLDQYTLNVNPNTWYKVIVHLDPNASRTSNNTIYVSELGLYDLSVAGPKDYWLMLGASIEQMSISNQEWKSYAKAMFNADPVVFNMSRGGWLTTQLLANLDMFLSMHPNARYCALHIGGNNVSFYRPWPGGSTMLQNDLTTILQKIIAAGKIPVMPRVTYRQYTGSEGVLPPTMPQANGSLPYNVNVIDPLIQQYSPDFWNSTRLRGSLDGYAFIRANPNYLTSDGVHMSGPSGGQAAWEKFWVQEPGPVIYGTAPNCSNPNVTCLPAIPDCGNGVIEAGEECDDGNRDSNDGCTNDCVSYVGANAESPNPGPPVFCPDGTVVPGTCGTTTGTATGTTGSSSGGGSAGTTSSTGGVSTSTSGTTTGGNLVHHVGGCAASPLAGWTLLLTATAVWGTLRKRYRSR